MRSAPIKAQRATLAANQPTREGSLGLFHPIYLNVLATLSNQELIEVVL